ncbi:hypothetical protein B484DRAFT_397640 [Ochromonadaceae sp. CCMP2298]|nr:hypothetical protein B484DRAFT_397640 [Ochromonadaceae sp. CCMP2298]
MSARRESNTVCACADNQPALNHLLERAQRLKSAHGNNYTTNLKIALLGAAKSVRLFPLPIRDEKDALQLQGVGARLATEIVQALGLSAGGGHSSSSRDQRDDGLQGGATATAAYGESSLLSRSSSVGREYRPEFGRIPWGILLALRSLNGAGNKVQVEAAVASLAEGNLGNYRENRYTAVQTLRAKGLIEGANTSGGGFALTGRGRLCAEELYATLQHRMHSFSTHQSSNAESGVKDGLECESRQVHTFEVDSGEIQEGGDGGGDGDGRGAFVPLRERLQFLAGQRHTGSGSVDGYEGERWHQSDDGFSEGAEAPHYSWEDTAGSGHDSAHDSAVINSHKTADCEPNVDMVDLTSDGDQPTSEPKAVARQGTHLSEHKSEHECIDLMDDCSDFSQCSVGASRASASEATNIDIAPYAYDSSSGSYSQQGADAVGVSGGTSSQLREGFAAAIAAPRLHQYDRFDRLHSSQETRTGTVPRRAWASVGNEVNPAQVSRIGGVGGITGATGGEGLGVGVMDMTDMTEDGSDVQVIRPPLRALTGAPEKTVSPLPALPLGDTWEVTLLVDKRERGNATIQASMAARNIPCELATLSVGDFLWVARRVGSSGRAGTFDAFDEDSLSMAGAVGVAGVEAVGAAGAAVSAGNRGRGRGATTPADAAAALVRDDVFVLDCVAERKTIADLASSLCDGRYVEQKRRLRVTGVRSVLYVVEGEQIIVPSQCRAITAAHIKTCIVGINAEAGMNVLRTRSLDHTLASLQCLHRQVELRFRRCLDTPYQRFSQYQALYGKKAAATNGQLFGHTLRQVHGCSAAAAQSLMRKYCTVARFVDSLKLMGPMKAEYVLSNVVKEGTKQKLGPALAKRLVQVYIDKY